MITFDEVMVKWSWKPIRGCPGRYILITAPAGLLLEDLLGHDVTVKTFQVPAARDTVVVVRLDGGGLISYRRSDQVYLHTLNNTEGFERKLLALGIELKDSISSSK
jgi:hypothetical protein